MENFGSYREGAFASIRRSETRPTIDAKGVS